MKIIFFIFSYFVLYIYIYISNKIAYMELKKNVFNKFSERNSFCIDSRFYIIWLQYHIIFGIKKN